MEHKQKVNNSVIKPVMYMVTSIKNTSRPVGFKTIPHLCVGKVGADDKLLQHFILSEAARVSLVIKLITCTDIKYYIITHCTTAQHA